MTKHELRWSTVADETFIPLAPLEYLCRWALYLYREYALVKLLVAGTALVALWVSLLEIADRTQERKLQALTYFNGIKGDASSQAVAALLGELREAGVSFKEIPTTNANLQRIDLSGDEIEQANLSGADLKFSLFNGASVRLVEFDEAYLNAAEFQQARVEETTFRGSKLAYSDFSGFDGEKVDFEGAFLFDADFSESSCMPCRFTLTTGGQVRFVRAQLRDANFWRAKIDEADFTEADLTDVEFGGADLTQAVFDRANLSGTKFVWEDDSAKVSPHQLALACTTGAQPVLPNGDEFRGVVIRSCGATERPTAETVAPQSTPGSP